jgi:hypothetical protein
VRLSVADLLALRDAMHDVDDRRRALGPGATLLAGARRTRVPCTARTRT